MNDFEHQINVVLVLHHFLSMVDFDCCGFKHA